MRTTHLAALAAVLLAAAAPAGALEPPVAAGGSQAAPLPPDEAASAWRASLATGLAARPWGMQLYSTGESPRALLSFGGQIDGAWGRSPAQAVRARFRLITGGEGDVYVPSDGEIEAAWALGRRELRFVLARLEVERHPALGLDVLLQAATLPSLEGSLSFGAGTMRLDWQVSPVEAAFVRYRGAWHVPHSAAWATESDRPVAASGGRLRYSFLVSPAVVLSVQGDVLKLWRMADLLFSAEGSVGYEALDRTALFSLSARANGYTRRGLAPATSETAAELLLVGGATLAF